MGENVETYEHESQCADGTHDFEPLPVSASGALGILLGHSRCRRCGVVADDWNVGPRAENQPAQEAATVDRWRVTKPATVPAPPFATSEGKGRK
jgi:hypothetical protein